jgi:transposase
VIEDNISHHISLTTRSIKVKEVRKEMIEMSKVKSIKAMMRNGAGVSEISRVLNVSEPTVRKYIRQDDFSPKPPVQTRRPSKLDPYKEMIEDWLSSDRSSWHKQKHTAKRIYDRLLAETDYEGSYPLVQRYVKAHRTDVNTNAYLDLVWTPATVQVDFGQADFIYCGESRRMHYLVVSFPYSNVGLAQVFFGENAECVCEGLMRVFLFASGVPLRCVFDNAAGVGRRVMNAIRLTELFERFEAHYGFETSLCNPNSGHEKGNVENMVGAIRRNLFVPTPKVEDIDEYNEALLVRCIERAENIHYRKGERCNNLFAHDIDALRPLPENPFSCVRYERHKADKQGNIRIGGKHLYSTDTTFAGREMLVGFGAFNVDIYDCRGNEVASHKRLYAEGPAESVDPASSLRLLVSRPGAWVNSRVRQSMPEDLRSHIDSADKDMQRSYLRTLASATEGTDYNTAITAMCMTLRGTGQLRKPDIAMCATRLYIGDAPAYDEPIDLSEYDAVFGREEGGNEHI